MELSSTFELASLSKIFERILELQMEWDQRLGAPAMAERGDLIGKSAKPLLEQITTQFSEFSFQPQVDGSNGFGGAARIPWLRVYAKEYSPKPARGWYLAYLFSATGDAVYLSLMQGVTEFESLPQGAPTLAESTARARSFLGNIDTGKLTTNIQLHDPRRRGKQYEKGTLYCIPYEIKNIPSDTKLADDLRYLMGLLNQLYIWEAGNVPEPVTLKEEPGNFSALATDPWDALLEETLWDETDLQEIVETLETSSNQIILSGPPGTGKTHVARSLAAYLTRGDDTRVRLVQFHPNYGYEEFVEGLRPVSDAGLVNFKVQPGVVKQVSEIAEASTHPFVLIVDEMNRANLPRVFGELMFLLEYRDTEIGLQYSDAFRLPSNLMIIGTMNTADRSIRTIDVALRRRFEIFDCPPNPYILDRYYEEIGENSVPGLVEGFRALNDKLTSYLDRHHTIGHTFFMNEQMAPDRLRRIWNRQISPLIEEYFFDQTDILADFSIEQFWPEQ